MDSSSKFAGEAVTPTKEKTTISNRSKSSENVDPNTSSAGLKLCNSPPMNTAKKSAFRKAANPNQVATSPSPKKKIRERKFVIAKKKSRKDDSNSSAAACEKCKRATGKSKCLCVAYESLRVSQDEFFINRGEIDDEVDFDEVRECDDGVGEKHDASSEAESDGINGELSLKRSRDRLMEEARKSIPEPGSGRVMHLVKAFENLCMLPKLGDSKEKENKETDNDKKGIKWALPGMHQSSLSSSDFFLTSANLGLDSRHSYSLDSSHGSISTRTSAGRRTSRRSSTESTGTLNRRQWKQKQKKATSLKPFMLRTELRGRYKEEEFVKKLRQMLEEEEKLRIPVAQGLPWTTDEPEYFPSFRPPMVNAHVTGEPWCMRWHVAHVVRKEDDIVIDYRRRLDRLLASDINWTPFGLNVARDVEKTLHHGTIRWMDTIEPYMSDRVLRQFGFVQVIPATPILPLQGSKREIKLVSYKVKYEPGDQAWNISFVHRLHQSYYGREARPAWETVTRYMEWYVPRTHPRVDPDPDPLERAEPSAVPFVYDITRLLHPYYYDHLPPSPFPGYRAIPDDVFQQIQELCTPFSDYLQLQPLGADMDADHDSEPSHMPSSQRRRRRRD